jgi:hypothetical protein
LDWQGLTLTQAADEKGILRAKIVQKAA